MPKKTHTIPVQFTPGSNFQKRSGLGAVQSMLIAWKSFYENQHKFNEIEIDGLQEDIEE